MIDFKNTIPKDYLEKICKDYEINNFIDPSYYDKLKVHRGLRNSDGTGVVAGLTKICNVHGYIIDEGEKIPQEGELIYRGINIKDIINGCKKDNRFGYEEVVYLLLFGTLPKEEQFNEFNNIIANNRELPTNFIEDMILKVPSKDIMNKLAMSVLALYPYDDFADDCSLINSMKQSLELIARFQTIIVSAYQSKKRNYDNESLFIHYPQPNLSTAENFLYMMRKDNKYTEAEAKLLDLCLILHAEHGGGNNSTFTTRVLTSSGTDIYGTIAGAINSLKGPKHGGANAKVCQMLDFVKDSVKDWNDDEEISNYLEKLIRKEAGDKSGLIYGMGHAVYTLSDPRAIILKNNARELAANKGLLDEFMLINSVERLAPSIFSKVKNDNKVISANVDLYSGFVYKLLDIPPELYTPLFAMSRISGWCAHRIEEITTNGKIIRPAYKSIAVPAKYISLNLRK